MANSPSNVNVNANKQVATNLFFNGLLLGIGKKRAQQLLELFPGKNIKEILAYLYYVYFNILSQGLLIKIKQADPKKYEEIAEQLVKYKDSPEKANMFLDTIWEHFYDESIQEAIVKQINLFVDIATDEQKLKNVLVTKLGVRSKQAQEYLLTLQKEGRYMDLMDELNKLEQR